MTGKGSAFHTGFLFPGQGSQYVGMGERVVREFPIARETFSQADDILGFPISTLCFQGPAEDLVRTENCQPAILTLSVAYLRVLQQEGIEPGVIAGHSLGEYSALVCAGALDFDAALTLVRKRGLFMERAVPRGEGGMAAVLGLDKEKVEEICRKLSDGRVLAPANFNCPGQIVVSGEMDAIEDVVDALDQIPGCRAIKLKVSGPFHSPLLKSAGEALKEELNKVRFGDLKIPIITNVDARINLDKGFISEKLVQQVAKPVLWYDTLKRMITVGVRTFVEVGPDKRLSGFVKKIDRKMGNYCTDDAQSFDQLLSIKGKKEEG